MKQMIEVRVPDIGDFSDVPVVEISVAAGETVKPGDTLIMLETDKAVMDIPCDHAGKVEKILISQGDLLNQGSPILMLELDKTPEQPVDNLPPPVESSATTSTVPAAASAPAAPQPQPQAAQASGARIPVYASPSVRHYARNLGVNVDQVTGSGPKDRILREDVEAFVKSKLQVNTPNASTGVSTGLSTGLGLNLPDWPQVDHASFGPVERQPLSRIARLSGPALARNALIIPHVCNFDEADVTDLEQFRKTLNSEAQAEDAKISMLAFTVKATVAALKKHPRFNSSLDADDLVVKGYWNIGVAADTPDGLVVPVIKAADKKGLREIAQEMASLAADARAGKLKAQDMQGAGFTISSLGGIGGTNFTPIINAPEVAILGMTRARIQPVWDGSAFQPRLIQPLSLSWDHRAVDGVAAARFLTDLATMLGDFRRISL